MRDFEVKMSPSSFYYAEVFALLRGVKIRKMGNLG